MALTLPTLYEYYTNGGITGGLLDDRTYFRLNDRNITIYSGAMHYFRVPRAYWRDRLKRMRAAGLNTVETYVPWNLHEPKEGHFDFGDGDNDMSDFLHLEEFLKTAKEEDLFVLARPGPYICSEWEFGGFPSWLLRYKGVKLRTSQQTYMQHVSRYFNVLLPILAMFQFTRGGPIIGFQVENEYGSTEANNFVPDKLYLQQLLKLFIRNGIKELLFTSDLPILHLSKGSLPELFLQTANFANDPEKQFNKLKQLQPHKPTMAMEFRVGWFDHWSDKHHMRNHTDFYNVLQRILRYPASVNMYMFHGGTNWGFLNGGDTSTDNKDYRPDTTSYDYDAPITEAGDYTEKYNMVKKIIKMYTQVSLKTPISPNETIRANYTTIQITTEIAYEKILQQAPYHFNHSKTIQMEFLQINNNSGQSYGYILYRKHNLNIPPNSVLKIAGRVCDTVIVLIDGIVVSKPLRASSDLNGFGYWRLHDSKLNLGRRNFKNATLDLLVENWGRVNYGHLDQHMQFKGLYQGGIYINNHQLFDYEIIPLEFKSSWNKALTNWEPVTNGTVQPKIYKAVLNINAEPQDTYIDMSDWTKGVVIINGFVLGRYSVIGPQQTLYLPAPFLRQGRNEILVFEHFYGPNQLKFSKDPIFKTN